MLLRVSARSLTTGTESINEATNNLVVVTGARLTETSDGTPYLRMEPRVEKGLTILDTQDQDEELATSKLGIKLQPVGATTNFYGMEFVQDTATGKAHEWFLKPKLGTGLAFDSTSGAIVVSGAAGTLPFATTSTAGIVIVGNGIDVVTATGATQGTISLKTASASQLGGIKIGSGLSIDANGVVTAASGLATTNPSAANYVTKFTGSPLSLTNSRIQDDTLGVGIGGGGHATYIFNVTGGIQASSLSNFLGGISSLSLTLNPGTGNLAISQVSGRNSFIGTYGAVSNSESATLHAFSGSLARTGVHPRLSLVEFAAPSIGGTTPGTSTAVTVYIDGAPSVPGANNLSLWVASGISQFGGDATAWPSTGDGSAAPVRIAGVTNSSTQQQDALYTAGNIYAIGRVYANDFVLLDGTGSTASAGPRIFVYNSNTNQQVNSNDFPLSYLRFSGPGVSSITATNGDVTVTIAGGTSGLAVFGQPVNNAIPKFYNDAGTFKLTNSILAESAGTLTVSGALTVTGVTTLAANSTVPTASAGDNTTKIASTAYVRGEIASLVASAPATLDTLNELAAALGNDPNFATTTATALANRLRIDVNTQGLTATQKGYGRTNLGIGTTDDVTFGTVTATTFTGGLTGNAATASKLLNARSITATGDLAWTVSFDGSANVTAGATLATVNSNTGVSGSAGVENTTASTFPIITVNGKGLITAVSTATVIAPANTLTGATLAANVVNSSLTSVGILTSLQVGTSIPAGTEVLRVGGSARISGTVFANDFVLLDGTGSTASAGPQIYVYNGAQQINTTGNPLSQLRFFGSGISSITASGGQVDVTISGGSSGLATTAPATAGKLTKFTGSSPLTLTDSILSDNGTTVTVTGGLTVTGTTTTANLTVTGAVVVGTSTGAQYVEFAQSGATQSGGVKLTTSSGTRYIDMSGSTIRLLNLSGAAQVFGVDNSGNTAIQGTLNAVGAITQNGNQVLHAGNVSSYALPLSGGTLTGVVLSNNDANLAGSNFAVNTTTKSTALYAYDVQRSGVTVGGITIGGVGVFASGTTIGGNTALHAANFDTYAVKRDGSNVTANQTWAISITGRAPAMFHTPTTSGVLDWNDVSNTRPGTGATLLLGTATNGMGGNSYYHAFNVEYATNDGTGNVTQMAVAYGTPANELYMRGRYAGAWSGWVRYLNSTNYNSYAPTLTGGGASGTNWNISITGSAATAGTATKVSNALSAGSYLSSDGTFDGSTARTFSVNATSANTGSTVVARDGSGNFSAGTISASLSGTASNASKVTNALSAGSYLLSDGTFDGSAARTFSVNATSANTGSTVVARDASGNFSAGTVSASLSGGSVSATTGSFSGLLSANGGSVINVQNQQDGGSGRGLYLWSHTDTNWAIYMGQAGASKSLAGATAAAGIDGRTGHAIRFRVNNSTTQIGFLWENSSETALMQLQPNTGNLYVKGDARVGGTMYANDFVLLDGTGSTASAGPQIFVYNSNTNQQINSIPLSYLRFAGSGVSSISATGGDVTVTLVGGFAAPATAVNNTLPKYSGTGTAAILINSIISDAGGVVTIGGNLTVGSNTVTAGTFSGSGASLTSIPIGAVTNLQNTLDAKAAASHTHPVSQISATGTASATTYLRGDGTWATITTSSGTVTSVAGSGGTTGLSFTGGPITGSGTLTLSGTLAVGSGGTGATDAATARSNLSAQAASAELSAIAGVTTGTGFLKRTGSSTWSLDTNTYLTGITSSQVTTALGYTPYNSSNPSGYISGISSSMVTTALGYTPYNSTNPSGYISGISSSMVTTALGYTPYNSSNPSGYINSSFSVNLGTTAVALNRASGALSLSGVSITGSAGSVANSLTIGTGLSGVGYNGSAAVTIAIDASVVTTTGSQTLSNKTVYDTNYKVSGVRVETNTPAAFGSPAAAEGAIWVVYA